MKQENREQEEELRRFRRLVRLLSSPDFAESNQARRAIQQIGGKAIDLLLILLEEEAHKRRRRLRLHRRVVILLIAAVLIDLAMIIFWFDALPRYLRTGWWVQLLSSFSLFLAIVPDRHKSVARMLSEFDDLRIVGPLLEARNQLPDIRKEIETALISLLPRLKSSDSALLTPIQRTSLYTAIQSSNAVFVVTVLQALEQIGNGDALPYVEKLIGGKSKTAHDVRVQEAAQTCLPFLQQCAEQEHAAATLLRASSNADPAANSLLRPDFANASIPPAQLLRASIAEERQEDV
ncbi:MAG TPA: hypothetical protein VFA07_11740 [Chthonomonadaceae bacterium]|nr:hypothetical protein [Chthonomonadaceae bacterium]